jgi:hypothetical protein
VLCCLSHISSPFHSDYSGDRVLWTICLGWPWTTILPISASWVARITGISHQGLASFFFCVCVCMCVLDFLFSVLLIFAQIFISLLSCFRSFSFFYCFKVDDQFEIFVYFNISICT